MSDSKRYLGLELAGAKNQKTALATIEYYAKEKKVFLLEIHDKIAPETTGPRLGQQSSDEALIELIRELKDGASAMGVNVPLVMPPCVTCTRKVCPTQSHCVDPAVKWMKSAVRRAESKRRLMNVNHFTPYTQRPIELLMRYETMGKLPESARFDIDETLGGNRAPLTARMSYLKRHLSGLELREVWPKLTIAALAEELELPRRTIASYRHLETGSHAREEILETLAEKRDVFIYERDILRLAANLASFNAFICAYTALLADLGQCVAPPRGFPVASGWIHYPKGR